MLILNEASAQIIKLNVGCCLPLDLTLEDVYCPHSHDRLWLAARVIYVLVKGPWGFFLLLCNDRKVCVLVFTWPAACSLSSRISSTSPTTTSSPFRSWSLTCRVWSSTSLWARPRYRTWPPSSPDQRNQWALHQNMTLIYFMLCKHILTSLSLTLAVHH